MARMILLTRLSLDQIGYPPNRPQARAIPQSFRTRFQALAQFGQLGRLQTGFASGAPGFPERLVPLVFPGLMPAVDRLLMHPQPARHLGLRKALLEPSGGFEAPPFQLRQLLGVALDAFRITHACTIA